METNDKRLRKLFKLVFGDIPQMTDEECDEIDNDKKEDDYGKD